MADLNNLIDIEFNKDFEVGYDRVRDVVLIRDCFGVFFVPHGAAWFADQQKQIREMFNRKGVVAVTREQQAIIFMQEFKHLYICYN